MSSSETVMSQMLGIIGTVARSADPSREFLRTTPRLLFISIKVHCIFTIARQRNAASFDHFNTTIILNIKQLVSDLLFKIC